MNLSKRILRIEFHENAIIEFVKLDFKIVPRLE